MAIKGLTIAATILLAFLIFGNCILKYMGVKLPTLHTSGPILLLLIIIKRMFAEPIGDTTTEDEKPRDET